MTDRCDKITVCIPTRRRNDLLRRLLTGLLDQRTGGRFDYDVVVVENDGEEKARPVVESVRPLARFPLDYSLQPVQNIALTRNQAVARAGGDYVAFMDDDVSPSPDWLFSLYTTMQSTRSDVVHGPVHPVFPDGTPAWVADSGFHDAPRLPTGTRVYPWATNNCLIRREVLERFERPFDPEYGITGGEDSDFFRRAALAGARFCWSAEARAFEYVVPERTRLSWILKESFSTGIGYMRIRLIGRGPSARLVELGLSCGKLALGAAALPAFGVLGLVRARFWIFYLSKMCGWLGQIGAHSRYRYPLYKNA